MSSLLKPSSCLDQKGLSHECECSGIPREKRSEKQSLEISGGRLNFVFFFLRSELKCGSAGSERTCISSVG